MKQFLLLTSIVLLSSHLTFSQEKSSSQSIISEKVHSDIPLREGSVGRLVNPGGIASAQEEAKASDIKVHDVFKILKDGTLGANGVTPEAVRFAVDSLNRIELDQVYNKFYEEFTNNGEQYTERVIVGTEILRMLSRERYYFSKLDPEAEANYLRLTVGELKAVKNIQENYLIDEKGNLIRKKMDPLLDSFKISQLPPRKRAQTIRKAQTKAMEETLRLQAADYTTFYKFGLVQQGGYGKPVLSSKYRAIMGQSTQQLGAESMGAAFYKAGGFQMLGSPYGAYGHPYSNGGGFGGQANGNGGYDQPPILGQGFLDTYQDILKRNALEDSKTWDLEEPPHIEMLKTKKPYQFKGFADGISEEENLRQLQ